MKMEWVKRSCRFLESCHSQVARSLALQNVLWLPPRRPFRHLDQNQLEKTKPRLSCLQVNRAGSLGRPKKQVSEWKMWKEKGVRGSGRAKRTSREVHGH